MDWNTYIRRQRKQHKRLQRKWLRKSCRSRHTTAGGSTLKSAVEWFSEQSKRLIFCSWIYILQMVKASRSWGAGSLSAIIFHNGLWSNTLLKLKIERHWLSAKKPIKGWSKKTIDKFFLAMKSSAQPELNLQVAEFLTSPATSYTSKKSLW